MGSAPCPSPGSGSEQGGLVLLQAGGSAQVRWDEVRMACGGPAARLLLPLPVAFCPLF